MQPSITWKCPVCGHDHLDPPWREGDEDICNMTMGPMICGCRILRPDVALSQALHRIGAMDCEADADDYDDTAQHRIDAHDLLDNLRAHGYDLVPTLAADGS